MRSPVCTGHIITSDHDTFRRIKEYFCTFLPYYVFSHDTCAISLQHQTIGKNEIQIFKKERKSAVNFRFLRIFSEDANWVKLMVIDIDLPMYHEAWIDADIPRPNLVVVNPVTAHRQYYYFLEQTNSLSERDRYWNIRRKLLEKLATVDCEVKVDFGKMYNYRSPLFKKGKRKGWLVKRGVVQTDFHYVILHHVEPYSLSDLALNDLNGLRTDHKVAYEHTHNYNNRHSLTHAPDSKSTSQYRHMRMFEAARGDALRTYDPDLTDAENIQNMFLIYQKHADPTLPECQIKASAVCTFNRAVKTYDPSKKGKADLDHSSERQRQRANIRWDNHREHMGETDKEGWERLGISKATFYRMRKKGTVQFIGRKWVKVDSQEPQEAHETPIERKRHLKPNKASQRPSYCLR